MKSPRIESQRLDVVLENLKPPAQGAASDVRSTSRPWLDEFELRLQSAAGKQAGRSPARLLCDEVTDFIIPRIGDPTILRGDHSVEILEHVVSCLLPNLQGSEELRAVAAAIISE